MIAAIVALLPALDDLRARRLYDSALTALGANDHDAFIRKLDEASAVAPYDSFFQHHAAAALLEQRDATPDPSRQRSLAREAASRLERSLEIGAHQEYAHFNLGWLYLDLARPSDSARHFAAAAHLVPDKGGVYFGLGLAHLAATRRDAAVRCFALEWINDPRSHTSPAWELPALAPLQPAIRAETLRLYARLKRDFPAASIIETWTRWWWGEPVAPAELSPGFNGESARFLAVLPALTRREPIPIQDARWAQAYAAWRSSHDNGTPAQPDAFLAAARGDAPFAAALARRARQHPANFRAFLAAPVDDEPALLRTTRRQRIGYGMLAFHPEGPPLQDLYIVQDNRVIADFAAGLFPAKGWLPGRYLLALLPKNPE